MADRPMLPPLPEELEKLCNVMLSAYEQAGRLSHDGWHGYHASHDAFEAEHAFRTALVRVLGQES